jgi:glutathione peroxidase
MRSRTAGMGIALTCAALALAPGCWSGLRLGEAAGDGGGGEAPASSSSGGGGSVASSTSSTSISSTGSLGTGGAGGGPFVCDPPAAAGSIFAYSAFSYDFAITEPVSMCQYRGDVMLIANTAALCTHTPQYGQLQGLFAKHQEAGFEVLGFLSNDFDNEGGGGGEVNQCIEQYGVTFDQFATIQVKGGAGQHPLFAWLTNRPGLEGPVTWNFNKFLIGRDGTLVARWTEGTDPVLDGEIDQAIQAELAKPAPDF